MWHSERRKDKIVAGEKEVTPVVASKELGENWVRVSESTPPRLHHRLIFSSGTSAVMSSKSGQQSSLPKISLEGEFSHSSNLEKYVRIGNGSSPSRGRGE